MDRYGGIGARLAASVTVAFLCGVAPVPETGAPSPSAAATDSGPSEELQPWMEDGLAALCQTVGYGFAYWDKESKKCIAIDLSSDSVYEVK